MRVADLPLPSVIVDDDTENSWTASWPIRPVIAIGVGTPYSWDDNVMQWDADLDAFVWDVNSGLPGFIDATCDLIGLDLSAGDPDDAFLFDAGEANVSLLNSDGRWSQYNPDGSPAFHGPGDVLSIWATDGTSSWWLFSGRIATWHETGDVVEIQAFDAFSDLAQPIGTFTPGAAGEHTQPRLESILTMARLTSIPHTFTAVGSVALTRQETSDSPLEEMQQVMSSDGGVIFTDADGKVVTYDRTWRAGRSDQTVFPVVSDNVCDTPIIVWNLDLSIDDTALADSVILQNVAKLQARADLSPGARGRFVITATDQQWTTQTEGDILSQFILSQQTKARVRVETLDLYLLDPGQPQLWRAVDWRLFDQLRVIHRTKTAAGAPVTLDVTMLIVAISHSVTASNWIMSVRTSRALTFVAPVVWNTAAYVWNDTSPLAVWSY